MNIFVHMTLTSLSKMPRSENNLKGICNKTLITITILFCEGGEKPVYLVEKDSVAVTSTEKPFWR